MQALIVGQNRIAGLGLLTLAESSGLPAEIVTLGEARARARSGDLILVYCDAVDQGAQDAAAALHASHARFIAVVKDLGAQARRALLTAGAVAVFGPDEDEDLALVLANYRWSAAPADGAFTLANGFVVDAPRRRLQRDGAYLELTLTECRLLTTLRARAQSNPGQPVSLPEINLAVWGFAQARAPTTIRSYVSQLRAKLEVDPARPSVLPGRRGRGYWLVLAS